MSELSVVETSRRGWIRENLETIGATATNGIDIPA